MKLESGLYVTATPIGNLKDITLRALEVMENADGIYCEDTRVTSKLLNHYGFKTKLHPYHEHNAQSVRPKILDRIEAGDAVVLVSDAGTPLISDPGYKLVKEAHERGVRVTTLPGPSAMVAALTLAGLPTDRFMFAGFTPNKTKARKDFFKPLAGVPTTLVFYEGPSRVAASLADMAEVLGANREGALCREITKAFEEVRRGTLQELADHYADLPAPKGEVVIVVGPPLQQEMSDDAVESALRDALKTQSVKEAATLLAEVTGRPRKELYQWALRMKDGA